MKIYVGYSVKHNTDAMLKFLDVDPAHPDGVSRFEQLFGCGYIRPGDFEIYEPEDMEHGFCAAEAKVYFPFQVRNDWKLWKTDLSSAASLFFILSQKTWPTMKSDGIIFTDRIVVQKLGYQE